MDTMGELGGRRGGIKAQWQKGERRAKGEWGAADAGRGEGLGERGRREKDWAGVGARDRRRRV